MFRSVSTATNTVDAAVAVCDDDLLLNSTPDGAGYGTPRSTTTDPVPWRSGTEVWPDKSGLTKGQIVGVEMEVKVGYTAGAKRSRARRRRVASPRGAFIKAGDSGSLLVTADREPVGLLFAGNTSGKYAWANDIDDVLAAFPGMSIDMVSKGQHAQRPVIRMGRLDVPNRVRPWEWSLRAGTDSSGSISLQSGPCSRKCCGRLHRKQRRAGGSPTDAPQDH